MKLQSRVEVDEIASALATAFDFPFDGITTFDVPEMPDPLAHGVGLIVGPSGSGKSTLLSRFGETPGPVWQNNTAVASHFKSVDEAIEMLGAVGLNSLPSQLRPYSVLSTGEKFRADLARQLLQDCVIDEFTSTVDRNVAKACARAMRRWVDQSEVERNVVLASCHYDIIDWLEPDWIFDTNTGLMAGRGLVRRPSITLEILPCSTEAWSMFRNHHYLDPKINAGAHCWIALWSGTPVGFSSSIAFPNGNIKDGWREHRTVVLPDFQGLGLGVRLSDAVALLHIARGKRYFSKTAHPRMGGYREASPLWKATSKNRRDRQDYKVNRANKERGYRDRHIHRVCYSHEYVG